MEFSIPIRVYIEDTDAGGIVYYVNYLKYMERCRTELLRSFGYGKAAMLEGGLLLVVKSASVEYFRPARLDDELKVTARPVKIARSYTILKQTIFCNGELLCEGEIKIACVSGGEVMRPAALPKDIHQKLKDYESLVEGV